MAAASIVQHLKDESTCSLCRGFYEDPVTTNCGHNFCCSCISERWKGEGFISRCPECREIGAPETLRLNRKLQTMVELVRQLPVEPERPLGHNLCEEHEEQVKGFCGVVSQPFCLMCNVPALQNAQTIKPRTESDPDSQVDRSTNSSMRYEGRQITQGADKDGPRRGTDELRLVLLGTTGAGKSATGNSLLGKKVFDSRASPGAVTRACQVGAGDWGGRPLVVVDTPGFISLTAPEKELAPEKERCAELSSPGPHALLLVLQAGRFTADEQEAVQKIQRLFGKEGRKFTVIVFTRGEDLEGKTIETFVKEAEEKLKELVRSCGRRVCALNNRATGDEREQQVRELIQIIDKMVEGNGNRYCTLRQTEVA